jgi:S1-C subfamily serine protease
MKTMKGKLVSVLVVLVIAVTAYAAGFGALFSGGGASAASAPYNQDTIISIYDSASPAVVEIDVTQQGAGILGRSVQEGQGSGFLIDNQGHILTNNHVVSGASVVKVVLKSGQSVNAQVVGTDPGDDVALVSVDPSAVAGIAPLQLGDSSLVRPGQMAVALGNPYGLTDTITVGVISGLNRSLSGSGMKGMIQTDAAINPGNSGGPLLDSNGMVIGINTAIESPSTGARGIGFAVPSNVAKSVLADLTAGKQVTRPWLGISGAAMTATMAQSLNLPASQGAYIISVIPNSPAANAGLKAGSVDASGNPTAGGDLITAIDGRSIGSVQDLSSYVSGKKVGDVVNLTVLRSGAQMNVQVTLGAWPANLSSSGSGPQLTPQPQPTPRTQPGMPGYNGRRYRQAVPTD